MGLNTIFFFIVLTTSANSAEWPRPDKDSCRFYHELESQLHCHKAGVDYLSHYAPYYCEAFMTQSQSWKRPLKEWVHKTGGCLQEMLYEHRSNPGFSCVTLEKMAFKTHTACYNAAELCQLSIGDIVEVIKVIKIKDLLKEFRYSYKEITKLGQVCVSRWLFE